MDVATWIADRGGVVRVRSILAAGATRYDVDRARTAGTVVPVTRGWIALPHADPLLVGAARRNVVLTCVTQARRMGLWVKDAEPRLHVGAGSHSGRVPSVEAVVHRHRPTVPRPPDALEDVLENVLVLVARCQPYESALAVWESALNKGLVRREALRRLDLPTRARDVLESAEPWSDSGLETLVVPRLRWLRLPLRRQVWIEGHRVDLLVGERLVLQIDGGHHTGRQRDEDIAHDAALMLMGYHVIRVGYAQVIERWESVQDLIMRAVAQGLHRAA